MDKWKEIELQKMKVNKLDTAQLPNYQQSCIRLAAIGKPGNSLIVILTLDQIWVYRKNTVLKQLLCTETKYIEYNVCIIVFIVIVIFTIDSDNVWRWILVWDYIICSELQTITHC